MPAEIDQYNNVCKKDFRDIKASIADLHTDFKKFYNDYYIGNGKPPHTVRMDRLERFMTRMVWFIGIVCVSGVGLIFKIICDHITGP